MSSEVLEMYETLDDERRQEVDDFIKFVVAKGKTSVPKVLSPIEEFFGTISDEDAAIMMEASRECRQDYGEW